MSTPISATLSRRGFLSAGAALVGSFAIGRGGDSYATGKLAWGDYPDNLKAYQLPAKLQAKNVLELFVLGGLSPWETFYGSDDPAYGEATDSMWWSFQQGAGSLPYWVAKNPDCKYPPLIDFMPDSLGHMVKFGTLSEPLRSRADILDRLRLHVVSHTIYPHDFARALAATGLSGGAPRLAGLGTVVGHYQLEHSPALMAPSYVLTEGPTLLPSASRVGFHPVAARPLELRVTGNPSPLFQTVEPVPTPVHNLAQAMKASYYQRHSWPNMGGHVRSASLANLDSIDAQLAGLEALGKVLTPDDFVSPAGTSTAGAYIHDLTQTKMKMAAKILTQTGGAARHVTVVDTGFATGDSAFGVAAYDFHTSFAKQAVDRYPPMWKRLCGVINQPGEANPAKIDLDQTLVVINTEFGRSPEQQDGQLGRNHHPMAYVTAMFGGPVGKAQKGIVGAIDADAAPVGALSPVETRMAVLVALGIYPFSKETFNYTDVPGAKSPEEALTKLNQIVLGVTP